MPEKHSWFSPSAAKANLLCPARAKQDAKYKGEEPPSEPALQGTYCHALCELEMKNPAEYEIKKAELIKESWQASALDKAIAQREEIFKAFGINRKSVATEFVVSLASYGVEDVFGTADIVAYNEQDKRLVVADYKFGMGIAVEAKNNAQLMLYAAGAMAAYEKVGLPVEMITLSIIQPRIYDKALTTTMFKSELLKWVNDTLLPGIALARSDNAEMTPGTEQCRWCSAAAHGCTGQNEALKKLLPVATGGLNIDTVDEDTLSTWLSNMGAFEQALKGIKQTAINRMLSGRKIKGFKLVLTQPREQWADLKKAEGLMKRNKIKESERFKKKLITPKQTEKKIAEKGLLTPRKLNALRRLVITPKGTPTYAPENDKRETYEPPIPMDALPDNSLDLEGLL